MSNNELEKRVLALEEQVIELKKLLNGKTPEHPNPNGPWWQTGAGRFANDPVFEEIVRLGREYRESLHPDCMKKKKKKKRKKNAHT